MPLSPVPSLIQAIRRRESAAAAITGLLARLADAWAAGDGAAYASCFWPDSEYVTYAGLRLRGRDENERLHTALFRAVRKPKAIRPRIERLAFLSDDAAMVTTSDENGRSRQLYLFAARRGEWLIQAFQATRVRPLDNWIARRLERLGSAFRARTAPGPRPARPY